MAKEKENSWSRAFRKLSAGEKIVFVAVIIIFIVLLAFLVRMASRGLNPLRDESYPDSGLAAVNTGTPDETQTVSNLPTLVQFPDTSYGAYVGGTEIYSDKTGATFLYSDNTMIVLSVQDVMTTVREAIEQSYPVYLSLSEGQNASYAEANSGSGYMNGAQFFYSAGHLKCSGKTYYILTYSYTTAEGKRLLASSVTADQAALKSDRDLMNQVIRTFCTLSDSENN